MMKPGLKLLFTVLCMAATVSLVAQSQKKDAASDDKSKDAKAKPKAKPVPVYLGKSTIDRGQVSKHVFDSLMLQGLTSKDSAGREYKVVQFAFTYAERNAYEDSLGNPMIMADYLADFCFGDTLNAFLKVNIPERSKPGDTVFIDQVLLKAPEGYNANGKSIKLVLTK